MLRVLLVTAPLPDQVSNVITGLRSEAPTNVVGIPSVEQTTGVIAAAFRLPVRTAVELAHVDTAIPYVESEATANDETAVVMIVEPEVAQAIVVHALEAPVVGSRLAFDVGAITEIEVRHDSPWTVSRLNDRCHLGVGLATGVG